MNQKDHKIRSLEDLLTSVIQHDNMGHVIHQAY